jgi:acetolactate synthase small subunit
MRVERVTFVIQGENRADVLAGVVQLFHDLNVEVEALYMVRRGSETLRIHVTIEVNQEGSRRVEASLHKVVSVKSVNTERGAKQSAGEAPGEESKGRSQS